LLILPILVVNCFSVSVTQGNDKAFVYPFSSVKRMLFFVIFFTAAFLVGTPYALLDCKHFLSDCLDTVSRFIHGESVILGKGWWYHLRFSLPRGMGLSLFLASLLGIPILIKKNFKKALILYSFPLAYYVVIGQGYGVFLRYVIPLIPYLCITAAAFTVSFIDGSKKYLNLALNKAVMLIIPFLIILPSVYNVLCCDALLSKRDNRLILAEWVDKNLPEGSSIAIFDSGYGVQLPPVSSKSLDKDAGRASKIMMDYLRKNKVKGFNAYSWDGKSSASNYILLEESPVKVSASIEPEQKAIIQKYYYLLSEFKSINICNKSNWFDDEDNFYMPFTGFKEVQRPGPNYYIYKRK